MNETAQQTSGPGPDQPSEQARAMRPIVVGVVPGQPAAVLEQAAVFAERFGADMICARVDASRYVVERHPDGTETTMPIDPDLADDDASDVGGADAELEDIIRAALDGRSVTWSLRTLAGGAASALARLADEADAAMIVVGTREPGLKDSLREFFNGSVAVQLAHRQHRPLVVIPLNPVAGDDDLPWTDR